MTQTPATPGSEPPRTLLHCEACDGFGGYEVVEGEFGDGPWRCRSVECECCNGLGFVVFEGETDEEQGEPL